MGAPLVTTLLLGLLLCTSTGCARLLYNFAPVRSGEIYRSAQPSPLMLRYLVSRYQVRSILNLRGRTPGYESAFAARNGLRLYTLDLSSRTPPTEAEVERLLDILTDAENHPILVHCRNGVDRSGYMVGLYRIEAESWDADRAVHEMNRFFQFEWRNPTAQAVVRDGARSEPD